MSQINVFLHFGNRLNSRILSGNNKISKWIFNQDTNASEEGFLTNNTKELNGGMMVIPYLRNTVDYWDELKENVSERS